MKTIAIAGTFDSKGEEFLYVKKLVEKLGLQTYMIHTGVFEPVFEPDVSNREVAEAAGFNDYHYFSKIFKKYHHCSPADYRKKQ